MLVLGDKAPRKTPWKEAGIVLHLIPLDERVDQGFVDQTVIQHRNDNGQVIRTEKDTQSYVELIGRHCIKSWEGVVDLQGNPQPCTPENINEFMNILPAQNFVILKVKDLSLHMQREVEHAKKGCALSQSSAGAEATSQ